MYDLLIRNATIVDGTGNTAPFKGDLAVTNGKIVEIQGPGEILGQALNSVDADGLHLAPGFIDAHSHGDQSLTLDSNAKSKLCQGVTTEIAGVCGLTLFPTYSQETLDTIVEALEIIEAPDLASVNDFTAFRNYGATRGTRIHTATFVGHGTVRFNGMQNPYLADPTAAELDKMKDLVREAMEQGCLGLSSGLTYVPGIYSKPEEMAALCAVVAEYDGIYVTHMRNEAQNVLSAIEEAVSVAKEANRLAQKGTLRLWISHIKVQGAHNWCLVSDVIELIEKERASGLEIYLDLYPYTSSSTVLMNVLPPDCRDDNALERLKTDEAYKAEVGERIKNDTSYSNPFINCDGWDGIVPISVSHTPEAQGLSIEAYARKYHYDDPLDAFFHIIIENELNGIAMYFNMNDKDVSQFADNEHVVIGSDGVWHSFESLSHPRTYGSFPRAIALFVNEKENYTNKFPIEKMIYKMTGQTAAYAGLNTKGLLKPGYDADLVLFNAKTVSDPNGFVAEYRPNIGIERVYISGKLAYVPDELVGTKNGTVIAVR